VRIVVVGAGIAGSSLARLARGRGHQVTLIGGVEPPHSLAGMCILRRGYHAGRDVELKWFHRSLDLYEAWRVPVLSGGLVSSYRRPGGDLRVDPDWRMVDPAAALLKPDIVRSVGQVTGRSASDIQGDAVVLATGHGEDGAYSYGGTWVNRDPLALLIDERAVRVHHMAPYKTLCAGVVGGRARLGSSSAADPDAAAEQAGKMLNLAHELGIADPGGWTLETGRRYNGKRLIRRRPDGAWELSGFHRTGYAQAPAAAEALLNMIEAGLCG
jgi:hypothetical protein